MKKVAFVLFLFFTITSLHALEEKNQSTSLSENLEKSSFIENSIFSLETSYTLNGLKNNGWGLGISYEHLLTDFWSIKGGFSHMTVWPHDYDVIITTVGISLNSYLYPFNKKLNWLYLGFGISTDFMNYIGSAEEKSDDTIINIFPQIGWKQNIKNYVLLDFFYGYKINISNNILPEYAKDLTKQNHEFGISFKLNLKKIFNHKKE